MLVRGKLYLFLLCVLNFGCGSLPDSKIPESKRPEAPSAQIETPPEQVVVQDAEPSIQTPVDPPLPFLQPSPDLNEAPELEVQVQVQVEAEPSREPETRSPSEPEPEPEPEPEARVETETRVETLPELSPNPDPSSQAEGSPALEQNSEAPPSASFREDYGRCLNITGGLKRFLVRLQPLSFYTAQGMNSLDAEARRQQSVERFSNYPISILSHLGSMDMYALGTSILNDDEEIASLLFDTGDYLLVRRDCVQSPATTTPNDADYGSQTYLAHIGVDDAWDYSTGSSSVTIAIVDSGIDSSLPELSSLIVPGINTVTCATTAAAGCGTTTTNATVNTCKHHGTEVAGTAAAIGNNGAGIAGVSWSSKIMPIRVSDAVDCTTTSTELAEGIVWASEHGAQIINVSYSGVYDPVIETAADEARRNGALVVFAAGNASTDLYTLCTGSFSVSACDQLVHNDVLIVGSTSSADASSAFTNTGALIDLVAQGENIHLLEAGGGTADRSGTSYSAPLVSGAAALILAIRPQLTPHELSQIILQSALDLGTAGEDNTFGVGLLQVDTAVSDALSGASNTQYADNAKLDFLLPKGPARFVSSDMAARQTGRSRLYLFSQDNPGLISIQKADIARQDLSFSEIPTGSNIGRGSLFYAKDDESIDFVMTDGARSRVFLGSTTAFDGSGDQSPLINSKSCGSFSEISDIHLTENASGVTSRLIVADHGASTIYSYTLNPTASSLCASPLSASVEAPLWLKSLNGANPRIYVGYKEDEALKLRAYQNSDLTATSAAQTITTSRTASFGPSAVDPNNNDLWVSVKRITSGAGANLLYYYTSAGYPPLTAPSIETCASPQQLLFDNEGANRLLYVSCPGSREIRMYNSSYASAYRILLPTAPLKIFVTSDGTYRYIGVLRSDVTFHVYRSPVSLTALAFTRNDVTLPAVMEDLGGNGALDSIALLNRAENLVSFVDLSSLSLSYNYYLPRSIDDIVAQTSIAAHFVSAPIDRAFSLDSLTRGAWRLRSYSVGDYPHKILYRSKRLFALNRDSDTLSVVNLSTRAVSSLATGDRPISMAQDTTQNLLWVANDTGASVTLIDSTVGSEAVSSTTALGITPRKLIHQSSDDTLYVAGSSSVKLYDGSAMTSVRTASFTNGVSDLTQMTGGAWVSSLNGISATYLDRATTTATSLTYGPQAINSNQSVGVVGMMNANLLKSSSGYSWSVSPFDRMFSNLSSLFLYKAGSYQLRAYPYANFNATTFPALPLQIHLEPNRWSSDTLGNLWMVQTPELKIERVTSQIQLQGLSSLSLNRPWDIAVNASDNRVYVLLRNLNALAVYDTLNSHISHISVCQRPEKLAYDSSNSKIFVLCKDLNMISVLGLDANGDVSSHSFLSTKLNPTDMVLNSAASRLYVVNQGSDQIQVFTTTSLGTSPTLISTSDEPSVLALNSASNLLYLFYRSTEQLGTINGAAATMTNAAIDGFAFTKAMRNTNAGTNWAISRSPARIYSSSASVFAGSGAVLVTSSDLPSDLGFSASVNKTYISFEEADAVRMYNEGAATSVEIAVGDAPRNLYVSDTASRIYVANYDADSVSVISNSTNAVLSTVSLTAGCGPTKMNLVSISGTNYIFVLCDLNDTVEYFHATTYGVQTPISLLPR